MKNEALLRDNLIDYCMKTFSSWKESLEQDFPNVRISVTQHNEKSRAMSGAKITALCSAMIMDAPTDQPDLIDLQFEFSDNDSPFYVSADLVWGDGDGHIEMVLSDSPLLISEEAVTVVKGSFPEFVQVLVSCLQRRKPSRLPPLRYTKV